jgi:hypothetical protein
MEPQVAQHTGLKLSSLPSKGMTYPKGAEISFRTYGYGEVKKISSSNATDKEAFAMILSGINTNFNKKDLTFGDFLYIALFRKMATLGTPKLQVPYRTPNLKEVRYHVFPIDSIEVQDLECPSLPICLQLSDGKSLEFMPITVGGVTALMEAGKAQDPTYMMAAQCSNLGLEEAYNYIASVSNSDDLYDLGEVEKLLAHQIKPIKVNCVETVDGKEITTVVPIRLEGRQSLLLPFRESGVSVRSGISFGKRAVPEHP